MLRCLYLNRRQIWGDMCGNPMNAVLFHSFTLNFAKWNKKSRELSVFFSSNQTAMYHLPTPTLRDKFNRSMDNHHQRFHQTHLPLSPPTQAFIISHKPCNLLNPRKCITSISNPPFLCRISSAKSTDRMGLHARRKCNKNWNKRKNYAPKRNRRTKCQSYKKYFHRVERIIEFQAAKKLDCDVIFCRS